MAACDVDSLTTHPQGAECPAGLWDLVWKMEPPMYPPVVPFSTLIATCPLLWNGSAFTMINCSLCACV